MLEKIALGIEYQGSKFCGWQRQPHVRTVQGDVEQAAARVANAPITLTCAGRTDAGVHAIGQVANFSSFAKRDEHAWLMGINTNLAEDVRIKWVKRVVLNFDARYSALYRKYRYVILNSNTKSAVFNQHMLWVPQKLDEELMHQAAQFFIGEQDFASFQGADCQSSTSIRNVLEFSVTRLGKLIYFDVQGNAFLHNMVRNMVGSLIEIGKARKEPSWIKEVLGAKARSFAAATAPAHGLFLLDVGYPANFAIPKNTDNIWLA
jgi:tRNA pseudouridine38-40 synthase